MSRRLLVLWVLVSSVLGAWASGCGGRNTSVRSAPPLNENTALAEAATPEATPSAFQTLGDVILNPLVSELESLLPALSQDGRIAVIETESDCCSGSTLQRGVIIRASQQSNWVLADLDETGESRVDPATSGANQATFLAEFEGRAFRPLVSTISTCAAGAACELGTQRGVLRLSETEDGQLVGRAEGRDVFRWLLPERELPRACCEGGLEEIPECFIRTNRWDAWAAGSKLLLRTAVESQADGCSSTASYEILEVAW